MAKSTSKAKQDYYARYKASNKWKSNRERKLLKQLKLQPNNEKQISDALANVKYRRKKPEVSVWSSSMRRAAQLLKEFSGSAKVEFFSANNDIAQKAMATTWRTQYTNLPQGKVDFSLGARLQGNK